MRNDLIILATAGVFFVSASVGAQTPSQTHAAQAAAETKSETVLVRLAPEVVQMLPDTLRLVSQQACVSFVCEGKPFRAWKTPPPLPPLIAKWPDIGVPLDEAVGQIADAYDYEAKREGTIFLLRKRYTDARDLPDVTADELRLALRDASRAASGLPAPTVAPAGDYAAVSSPFASAFFKTLPSAIRSQFTALPMKGSSLSREAMFSGDYGSITISNMTPAQKNALWQGAVSRHIQAATGKALTAYQALLTLEEKNTAFFGAEPLAHNKNEPKTLAYTPKRSRSAVFPAFVPDGRFSEVPPLPVDCDAGGVPIPASEPDEAEAAQTLQSLCTGKNAARFLVDPALEAKSVLVIASPEQKPAALFQAAGAVYGLRVLHGENDTFRISRARALVASDLRELNNAVLSAFPEPLLRAFHGGAKREASKQLVIMNKRHENDPNFDHKAMDSFVAFNAELGGRFDAQNAMRLAALHRFRVLLTPRLANGVTVSSEDLTPEEKQMLTLAIAAAEINTIDGLESKMPAPTRAGLEQGRVMILVSQKETRKHFGIYVTVPSGKNDKESSLYHLGNTTLPTTPAAPAK